MPRVSGRCYKRAWCPAESRVFPRDRVVCDVLELEAARTGEPASLVEVAEVYDPSWGRVLLCPMVYEAMP